MEIRNGVLYLKIKVGNGEYVEALVKTSHPELESLLQRVYAGLYYNVELTLKDGEVYASFTWKEEAPPIAHTKEKGVVGVDINADPYHLALALVSQDSNLRHYFTIPLTQVDVAPNRGAKETILWMVAHEVTDFAVANRVAIATERLKYLRKTRRGDGSGRDFRRKQHRFAYASLLKKIHTLALKRGIEVIEVNPQDTSTTGMLKYAPQLSLSKDVAAAYVIGRRALGFEERLPKNYQKLLEDKTFHQNAVTFYQNLSSNLDAQISKEKNPSTKRRLLREKSKAQRALDLLSSQSSPAGSTTTNARVRGKTRGRKLHGRDPWRVLRLGAF